MPNFIWLTPTKEFQEGPFYQKHKTAWYAQWKVSSQLPNGPHTDISQRTAPTQQVFQQKTPPEFINRFFLVLNFYFFLLWKLNLKFAKLFPFLMKFSLDNHVHCNHHISSNFIRSCHLDYNTFSFKKNKTTWSCRTWKRKGFFCYSHADVHQYVCVCMIFLSLTDHLVF